MLHSYTYKPEPIFHIRSSEGENKRFYGLELETDEGHDCNEYTDAIDALNLPLYCKYDGSLGYGGVEIVTHPCTLSYLRYDMRFRLLGRVAKRFGYKADTTDTCGYHIHVSREGLGDTPLERRQTAAKLVLLVDAVWDTLVKFTRREVCELNHWAPRPYIPAGTGALVTVALRQGGQGSPDHSDRYTAVNLTNEHTVEFRVFRGTLKRDTIIAAVELVDNMCRYAMAHTPTECHRATWADIVGVESYKELNEYCVGLGIA